jgi:hypothetical protein
MMKEYQEVLISSKGDKAEYRPAGMGPDQCFSHTLQLAELLNLPKPELEQQGTLAQYHQYDDYVQRFGASKVIGKRTWFEPGTPPGVCNALDTARIRGNRVRLWSGGPVTGEAWWETDNVIGYIGRTSGPLRQPTLIKSRYGTKGERLSTLCVVRIMDTKTRKELYRHPHYHMREFVLSKDSYHPHAPFIICSKQGETLTRFEDKSARQRWIEFMNGDRFTY